jgi:hypothetical protein
LETSCALIYIFVWFYLSTMAISDSAKLRCRSGENSATDQSVRPMYRLRTHQSTFRTHRYSANATINSSSDKQYSGRNNQCCSAAAVVMTDSAIVWWSWVILRVWILRFAMFKS